MQMKDDAKLDEVKAILRRLQRIGTGDEESTAPAAPEPTPPSREGSRREWTRHKVAAPPNRVKNAPPGPHGAPEVATERRSSSQLWKIAFVALPALLLVVGLSFTFWPRGGEKPRLSSPPDKTAELSKAQPSSTGTGRQTATATIPQSDQPQSGAESSVNLQNAERISHAQRLIDEGKIVAGRDLLLGGLAERKADAALVLARSYDPNSLRLILNADAPPDIEEAERWYRHWHEIAASDGLALDTHRLDRIIKAMR
jgi:hypothetical protein